MSSPSSKVESRGDQFAKKLETKITQEIPSAHNPFHAETVRIHGYDHMELIEKCEFSEMIFLLLKGELPSPAQKKLFNQLAVALINPGPRHPATQGSMVAGVGKTFSVNILPISLTLYGGEHDSAGNVEAAMRLFRRSHSRSAQDFVKSHEGGIPGFGTSYGDPDPYAEKLLGHFIKVSPEPITQWVAQVHDELKACNIGIMRSGICAAVLSDLGFHPRQGSAIMQLMAAPGLLAHGLEYSNKPLTSMLFESDDNYEIQYPEENANHDEL